MENKSINLQTTIVKKYRVVILVIFISGCINLVSAQLQKQSALFGVNLAGAEFGHGSKMPGEAGIDYYYPTVLDLDYWKSKGLKLIRIPFKWERVQHELNGALTSKDILVIRTLLNEAEKRDMKVILDLHNYGRRKVAGKDRIIGSDSLKIENLADFWGKLSKEMKYHKALYGYALMNEPHDMLGSAPWSKIAQAAINEIRKNDTLTPIIVGGDHWSSAMRWKEVSDNLKYLYDPGYNLIFEAHVYFDKDGSGVYRNSFDKEEAFSYIGVERLQPFVTWLRENNLQGFVGEYGVPANDGRWFECLDHLLSYMKECGISGTYWAAGSKWNNYILSVQPKDNYKSDMPQTKILVKYIDK
jgi:endoglucanase